MITGDKQETAINIAIACKLITHSERLLLCNAPASPEAACAKVTQLHADVCRSAKCSTPDGLSEVMLLAPG